MKKLSCLILLLLLSSLPVLAAQWETVYESKIYVKVDIDRSSITTNNVKGQKIINFWARGEMTENNKTAKSLILYEANCTTSSIYHRDVTYTYYENGKEVRSVQNKVKKKLVGKDKSDIKPVVDKLCNE